MREIVIAVALSAVVAGCVSPPPRAAGHTLLARAETLLVGGDYAGALAAYEEFLNRYPDHTRVRAARDTVAQIVVARAELARLRDELASRDRELARARDELAKTRQELQTRQAETKRLRGDLERLKEIDLKPERKRP